MFPEFEKLVDKDGTPFFKGLDANRYGILKNYAENNWEHFFSIKVSDVISAYLLRLSQKDLVEFVYSAKGEGIKAPKASIESAIRGTAFSNAIVQKELRRFGDLLFDHTASVDLDKADDAAFVRFLRRIRKFTKNFKRQLQELDKGLYVAVYQAAGSSIRKLGKVDINYRESVFDTIQLFHLPETINRIIKVFRRTRDNAYVVIDAIKNPYEARFFKERYAAFYLVSVNAPDDDRKEYLQQVHKFNVDQLAVIDRKESGKDDDPAGHFISPNVKKCIEMSDIHMYNPRREIGNNNILSAQLAWYFALMHHPGLVSPTSMERTMEFAYSVKRSSGCISRQVGAVITDTENSVKAIGWNDVPKGQVPCVFRSVEGALFDFDAKVYSSYERTNEQFRVALGRGYKGVLGCEALGGRNLSYCFKDVKNSINKEENQVHTRSIHAEENAFLQLAKYGGQSIRGGRLYTTASPCELCSKKAYQLGIAEIIYIDPYPGIANTHVLDVGETAPKLIQFRGAVGRGFHQLYEMTLPYKDELELLLSAPGDCEKKGGRGLG
ncbi:deoxycytidylate deaminase [Methylogaea oryzae]|uniref:deoxycytidylate deaminase n=1 Tax=Methylogaea oryzae TaxID=1295382 RepID=UPI000B32A83D|nr:deoxycytidylate deaminase [Methylogaea oryzae]